MNNSFFNISHYIYSNFSFSCNFEFSKEQYQHPELIVASDIQEVENKENLWNIAVTVSTPKKLDRTTFPFSFDITVTGLLICAPIPEKIKKTEFKKMLYVNAASILYSSIRDRLSQFAFHPVLGTYLLPTHRFIAEDIKE